MDLYGAKVLHFAYTFFADMSRAHDAYISTFVRIYRKFDALPFMGDDEQAIIAMTIQVCMAMEIAHASGSEEHNVITAESEPAAESTTEPKEPTSRLLARISAIDAEEKAVLLANVFTTSDLSTLAGMFLRPKRWILAQREHALATLSDSNENRFVPLDMDGLRADLQDVLTGVVIPHWLRIRASQQVRATVAQMAAERRHRGPTWLVYATGLTCVFSLAAIGLGVPRGHRAVSSTAGSVPTVETAKGLPDALQHLPGTVQAQFQLPDNFPIHDLDHMAIGKDAVYLSTLEQHKDKWATIQVNGCDFNQTGSPLTSVEKHLASVETVPPLTAGQDPKSAHANWTIQDWSIHFNNLWAVVLVDWAQGTDKSTAMTQVYDLYLPTGKSSLVKSIGTEKQPNEVVVTAGGGKIIVQSGIQGKASAGANPLIGLPIDVYTLSGTEPLRALTGPTEISAPFGLMVHPTVTGGTLAFQGIAGQPDDSTAANATWYTLSWDGQLSRYAGPPLDGRPHWAVRGSTGKLWWCETTPDPAKQENIQVLMAPMVDASTAPQVAASSLSGSVQFFTVSGESMAWVQTTKNIAQLVVESVQ